nr:hypothetical protein CFP56_22990 [Quercus suber]
MPAKSLEEKSMRKRTQSDADEDQVPSGVFFLPTKRTQSDVGEELICDPLLLSVCFVGDDMGVIPKQCIQISSISKKAPIFKIASSQPSQYNNDLIHPIHIVTPRSRIRRTSVGLATIKLMELQIFKQCKT